jgi:hypothetical protein
VAETVASEDEEDDVKADAEEEEEDKHEKEEEEDDEEEEAAAAANTDTTALEATACDDERHGSGDVHTIEDAEPRVVRSESGAGGTEDMAAHEPAPLGNVKAGGVTARGRVRVVSVGERVACGARGL